MHKRCTYLGGKGTTKFRSAIPSSCHVILKGVDKNRKISELLNMYKINNVVAGQFNNILKHKTEVLKFGMVKLL